MQSLTSVLRPHRVKLPVLFRAKSVCGLVCLFALTLICTLGLSVPVIAAEPLPAGVIAMSLDKTWQEAKAFCASKGGKLPLIGGKSKIASSKDIPPGTPVAGFGSVKDKWPSDLPGGMYWTGTERADRGGGVSWIIHGDNKSGVAASNDYKTRAYRVVCVP